MVSKLGLYKRAKVQRGVRRYGICGHDDGLLLLAEQVSGAYRYRDRAALTGRDGVGRLVKQYAATASVDRIDLQRLPAGICKRVPVAKRPALPHPTRIVLRPQHLNRGKRQCRRKHYRSKEGLGRDGKAGRRQRGRGIRNAGGQGQAGKE